MGKHERDGDSEQQKPHKDDKNKDDEKDTSRHSVEHDKQTSTTPDPDDYK
jgi:hypothetical protein